MQNKTEIGTFASLLPYLEKNRENSSPALSLAVRGRSVSGSPFPFQVLDDSSPAAMLLNAEFVTDAGSVLKKVFLLLQKDNYSFRSDELWPVANPDVDHLWQQAFSFHDSREDGASGLVSLFAQLHDKGGLQPLAPLFFCKKSERFFHPPCPKCGLPLQLCCDDDLLDSVGLQPYATSLQRYLYCPPCSEGGVGAFYARDKDRDQPPSLRDGRTLIDEFGALRQSRDPVSPFPCIRCPEHGTCYGPDGAAGSRIVPFSFYPFHLLVFDALSLNALDFLPLISGASPEDVASHLASRNQSGRSFGLAGLKSTKLAGATFFAPHDGGYFSEVLFLKLAFLGDVLGQFLTGPDLLGHPDMRPTIDRVWVDLPDRSGLLPFFWNFRTRVIDLVGPPDRAGLPAKEPSSSLRFYLGMLWFYALLVNKKQGNREVIGALKAGLSGNEGYSEFPVEFSSGLFAPENIFWDPDGGKAGEDCHPLWKKALDLGLRLLRSATGQERNWSSADFLADCERLRTEVKKTLFRGAPSGRQDPVRVERNAEQHKIGHILSGIREKWRDTLTNATAPEPAEEAPELLQTVILAPLRDVPSPAEEYTETVVLSTNHLNSDPVEDRQQKAADDPLSETVIIGRAGSSEELAATVILTLGTDRIDSDIPREPSGEDDPEATVILPPRKTRERDKARSGGYE